MYTYAGFTLRWPSELEVTSCAPSASATISESPDTDEARGDNGFIFWKKTQEIERQREA